MNTSLRRSHLHILLAGYLVSTTAYTNVRSADALNISGSTGGFRGLDLEHISIFAASSDDSMTIKHVSLGLILSGSGHEEHF